jgi:four helix bundle protein
MNDVDTTKPRFNFRAYERALRLVTLLVEILREIARHDADLARQARRCLTSVPLNIAEGAESSGKLRIARYRTSLGSVNELIACLDVAEALGYVRVDEEVRDAAQYVRATLLNLVRPKR